MCFPVFHIYTHVYIHICACYFYVYLYTINTAISKFLLIVINILHEKSDLLFKYRKKMKPLFRYRKWNCHVKLVQWSILLKYWAQEVKEKTTSGNEIITTEEGEKKVQRD